MQPQETDRPGTGIAKPAPPESHAGEHLESVLSGRLRQALLLTGIILVVELAGGILSGSLALMADAGHVTTDVLALGLAWYAVEQTKRPADEARTFGYHRAGILAATANGVTLIVLVLVIAYEAVQRFAHPQPVQGGIVIISALVGVAVNGYIAFNFRGQGGNLNVRAAVLHAVGDMIASIGVILAGAIILLTGWTFADPIVSILIAALIGWNAFRIVLETVNILLEGTPRGLDVSAIRKEITGVAGVLSVHDLHVWCISSEHTAMSCHIVVGEQDLAQAEGVMRVVEGVICERFAIGHTTVQLEYREPCSGDADHLAEHNHPHRKLARMALSERRRTPLSRHRRPAARSATAE
jgi:cobalt-zinc-cadmium efflux system protein